jgi:hypothetical protein
LRLRCFSLVSLRSFSCARRVCSSFFLIAHTRAAARLSPSYIHAGSGIYRLKSRLHSPASQVWHIYNNHTGTAAIYTALGAVIARQ